MTVASSAVWLVLLVVVVSIPVVTTYPVGPNRLLGTCLDAAWVKKMETELHVSSQDRDTQGRLVRPFLQKALTYPRYSIEDPRTESAEAFTDECLPKGQAFYGADQSADGSTRGTMKGTLVLDVNDWDSHMLASMVLGVVAEEVSGYKIAISYGGPTVGITQRMSSARSGICTPVHMNIEAWTSSTMSNLRVYFNESYKVGGVGYFGSAGVYASHALVEEGLSATPPYFPDFWKHFKLSDSLIDKLSVVPFKANPAYNPPNVLLCEDGVMGCKDNCEKSEACTEREAGGKNCLVVAMMKPGFDRGFFQAVLSNIGIPAYFCFLGYGEVSKYASAAAKSKTPVIFYHFEPDMFHVTHKGLYDRVFLPRTDPDRIKLSTGDYGENGFGKKTNNPVDVDFPSLQLTKFASLLVKQLPVGSLFSKLTLSDTDINNLLSDYNAAITAADTEPYFRAACNWVKGNYDVWSEWLDRLPLCALEQHIISHVSGCDNGSSVRTIEFAWKAPNPGNTSLPNDCDGGVNALPATIHTSRSCDWIDENRRTWSNWIDEKPTCDSSFFEYSVSECDSDAYRAIEYFWKLPNATNDQLSGECKNGDGLPKDLKINCEYMPTSSSTFAAVAVLAVIMSVLLVVAIIFVFKQRAAPIIRRSQYEMLLLMLSGGFLTTGAAVAYAGRPSQLLCGLRPVLISLGFTTIFGSLIMKSLRVYRVFLKSAMKRVTVTLFRILKILSIFYAVDIVIFVVWYAADFPEPTITTEEATEFRGTVDRISCESSSFIFTALLIFWKAIVLMVGLYLSFLIRNVSVDFQETPWIFGSVVVVLVGCLVILPMTYLVEMRAAAYYVFLACGLLFSTFLIMCLMLVPKIFRLKEESKSTAISAVRSNSTQLNTGENTHDTHDASRKVAPSVKYQVRPSVTKGMVNVNKPEPSGETT